MATEKRLMCVDDFKKNLCHYCNTYMSEEPCEPGECWVHDVIAQTGTVDAVEVVRGQWIPVTNRLPDNFVSVLGYMTDAGPFPPVRECYNVGNGFFFPALEGIHSISHWMPLPEPPETAG